MNADDIITELGPQFIKSCPALQAPQAIAPDISLTSPEHSILLAMGTELIHIDALATATAIDIPSLLVHLFELELKSAIMQQPGQFFRKKTL